MGGRGPGLEQAASWLDPPPWVDGVDSSLNDALIEGLLGASTKSPPANRAHGTHSTHPPRSGVTCTPLCTRGTKKPPRQRQARLWSAAISGYLRAAGGGGV